MVTVRRPSRIFSFGDFAKTSPREPPPGDRLDAQFHELIDAIRSTQDALAQIRRDDGKIKAPTVLEPQLLSTLVGDYTKAIAPMAAHIVGTAKQAHTHERNAALYAADAEAAVQIAQQLVNGLAALRQQLESKSISTKSSEEVVTMLTTEAENWATYSKAQADVAIVAKDEALQWAEYLAGPVVDAGSAPEYIANSPFPNGLFYQPVQGGLAGLWSAKWWALQAYNLVGAAGAFYLGPWPGPPLPGEVNPDTGQVAPDPLNEGSIYFDTSNDQIMVWNGSAWVAPAALTSTFTAQYVYKATAGQQNFSGPDLASQTPVVAGHPSDVHVNGIRLVKTLDYTIAGDVLTIAVPLAADSIVQWDLLLQAAGAAGSITAWKIAPLVPDGTTQNFTLKYIDGATTPDANVGDGVELQVSLDGVIQEPGSDYSATGNTLHMAAAPPADGDFWAVWFQPG